MSDQKASVSEPQQQEEHIVNDAALDNEMDMDIDDLKATIVRLQAEVDANLDGWQRSRAEFNNYRKRTQQQLSNSKQQGAIEAFSKLLPVFDDFERAFDNVPAELEANPWVSGTSLILKNIQKVLNEFNVETLDPVGEEFDPTQHEAIGMEDSDEYESGTVTTTLQKGYKFGDQILRPALVRVAS
ncbi:MAG: nucleotide exchange factor GrpE [Phototrophicaceae bacterium]